MPPLYSIFGDRKDDKQVINYINYGLTYYFLPWLYSVQTARQYEL